MTSELSRDLPKKHPFCGRICGISLQLLSIPIRLYHMRGFAHALCPSRVAAPLAKGFLCAEPQTQDQVSLTEPPWVLDDRLMHD
jgi:hypothetical protein